MRSFSALDSDRSSGNLLVINEHAMVEVWHTYDLVNVEGRLNFQPAKGESTSVPLCRSLPPFFTATCHSHKLTDSVCLAECLPSVINFVQFIY